MLILPIVLLTIGLGLSTPAFALELFGKCLIGPCTTAAEQDGFNFIDPKRYTIDFQVESADDGVKEAVNSASNLWQGREDAVGGSAGLITRAKGDYQRILAALYNEGYYGGSISIKIDGREAATLSADVALSDQSSLLVSVDSGPKYIFGRAEVAGAAPPTDDKGDRVPSFEEVGFARGLDAKAGRVGKAAKLSRDAWRQRGYSRARIVSRKVTANHPARELNVLLEVESGQRATYGQVSVDGTDRMDPVFVARHTGIVAGAEYDPDDIERAKKRIERLGVFSTQKIEEADQLEDGGVQPLTIIVSERKTRRIGIGATLSSIDGLGFETFWLHRNLFRRAERLKLSANVSGLGSTFDYQQLDYNVEAAFTKPGVFTPDTDFNLRFYGKREVNDAYTETSGGGSASVTHHYSDSLTYDAGIFAEYGRFEGSFGTRDFVTAGLDGSVVFDNRDSKLDPTRGFYLRGNLKPFYEFNFGNVGVRTEAEARFYAAFDSDARTVLAGRINFGSILGTPRNETPENLLFFAGGGGSVRGYGFNNIGIIEADGTVSGGRSKLEASVELRFKATEKFGVVAFADAGIVSRNSFPDFNQDVRVGVGVGLRYQTGLGPIRLDIAVPINRQTGDPSFGFYAGIGQAF